MSYDLHPILVHFPIAILAVYSLIKVLPWGRWFPKVAWHDIERALLVFGLLGAFAALGTGENAEHLTKPNHNLVEWHSFFAGFTTWLYAALLVGEAAHIVNSRFSAALSVARGFFAVVSKGSRLLDKIFTHSFFSRFIALVAFVTLLVTGLLGGVMVYGTTADPLAPFVLKLLGISL